LLVTQPISNMTAVQPLSVKGFTAVT